MRRVRDWRRGLQDLGFATLLLVIMFVVVCALYLGAMWLIDVSQNP